MQLENARAVIGKAEFIYSSRASYNARSICHQYKLA